MNQSLGELSPQKTHGKEQLSGKLGICYTVFKKFSDRHINVKIRILTVIEDDVLSPHTLGYYLLFSLGCTDSILISFILENKSICLMFPLEIISLKTVQINGLYWKLHESGLSGNASLQRTQGPKVKCVKWTNQGSTITVIFIEILFCLHRLSLQYKPITVFRISKVNIKWQF